MANNNGLPSLLTQQQGYSTLLMVMLLFTFAVIELTLLEHQLSELGRQTQIEVDFYKQYQQAASSLHWGLQQHWPQPTTDWFCLHAQQMGWSACLKRITSSSAQLLLKGGQHKVKHYWLVQFNQQALQANLIAHAGNWLDYCPLKKVEDCE